MNIRYLLKNKIEKCEEESFKRNLILDNIHRGKILAVALIGFEIILSIVDIGASILKVNHYFRFNDYLMMYFIMILINISFLLLLKKVEHIKDITFGQIRKLEIGIVSYITLIMSWGSMISLMDQKLYGHVVVFMMNMIICSVVFFLDKKMILVPYFFSVLIISLGLPFFQSSNDILIGHYVNLCTFIIISWLASRIIYHGYCNDYNSKVLLKKSKILLEKEIEENKRINVKLALANLQLKEVALIDELTGIPNRRSFRNYIDNALENFMKENSVIAILMIDIDFFKQFNDNYGHEKGDTALIKVANEINSIIRSSVEFFGRWGGEEFIYSVFNTTEDDVVQLAETIKQKVYGLKIPHEFSENNNYISVSIGTCTIKITGQEDVSKGIQYADKALYLAKKSGRNCVKYMNHG